MSNFLDANVWLALSWSRHAHGRAARSWFDKAEDQRFVFCRFTQITVLRLLTTEKVMGSDTRTMSEAWRLWDRVVGDPRIEFFPEPPDLEEEFRSRSRFSSRSPKLWADTYLLAFAAVAGLRFVTFDRALRSLSQTVLVL